MSSSLHLPPIRCEDKELAQNYLIEGWGVIAVMALGIAPEDVESTARRVCQWAWDQTPTEYRYEMLAQANARLKFE